MQAKNYIVTLTTFLVFSLFSLGAEAQVVETLGDFGPSSCGTGSCTAGGGPLMSGRFGKRQISIGTGFDGGCGGSPIQSGLQKLGLGGNRGGNGGLFGGGASSRLGGIGSRGIRANLSDGSGLGSRIGNGIGSGIGSGGFGNRIGAGGLAGGGAFGGRYATLMGGLALLEDQFGTGLDREVDTDFSSGSILGGAIGIRRGRLRYEVEYTLRNNSAEGIIFNGNTIDPATVGGRVLSHSGMFNFALDVFQGRAITPYVGAGVGFSFIDSDLSYGALPARLNGEDNAFAYQGFAGLAKRTSRGSELFVEYRYFAAVNPKLNRFGGPAINGAPQDVILLSEYDTHNILFGLRLNF